MKNFGLTICVLIFAIAAITFSGYSVLNYIEEGGARTVIGGSLDVVSGGEIDVESGGSLKINGTAITTTAAELNKLHGINWVINGANDVNGTDDYKITLSPAPTAYVKFMTVVFDANTTNTGACTLNVNGLGAKALKIKHDQNPPDGYIEPHEIVMCTYDGTNFQIHDPCSQ